MNKMTYVGMIAVLFGAALATGCASKPPENLNSGYLGPDYKLLKETKDPRGTPILRYVDPKLNPGNYNAVMLDDLVFYPKAQPSEQVSSETLTQIRNYVDQTMHQKFGEKFRVVDQPGPGVARISIAFTSVVAQNMGLSDAQYIPIAFLATMGTRAVTGTPQDAKLLNENRVVDSVTGQRLAIAVRWGTGEELKKAASGERVVTLEAVKPLIDHWIEGAVESLNGYVAPK